MRNLDDGLQAASEDVNWADTFDLLMARWRLLLLVPLLIGALTFAATYLVKPVYTARTVFMPPQQQSSGGAAAAAMASLGALAALAGVNAVKTPADQYVALMHSVNVTDTIVDRFKLLEVYDEKLRVDARKELGRNVVIKVGKRDGLISIDVDDTDPARAAAIANQYVEELRRITGQIAVTEAQQRRVFFESQLQSTRDNLSRAQQSMQETGITQGALKAEPRAAAEGYARLRAELTGAEVKLQAMRRAFADSAPELQQQGALVAALRGQLGRLEQTNDPSASGDYVTKFREYKYQEALFELFARQYEMARVDESREGALIQVVDVATPPEKKSKPRRSLLAAAAGIAAFVLLVLGLMVRHFRSSRMPVAA